MRQWSRWRSAFSPSRRRTANISSTLRSPYRTAKSISARCGSPACRPSYGSEAPSANSLCRFRPFRKRLRRLGALEHAVIADYLGDADAVIGEDLVAAARLGQVMLGLLT